MEETDRFLMGVDLRKDPARIEAAYDDAAGITAEFNRNMLRVLNREAGDLGGVRRQVVDPHPGGALAEHGVELVGGPAPEVPRLVGDRHHVRVARRPGGRARAAAVLANGNNNNPGEKKGSNVADSIER